MKNNFFKFFYCHTWGRLPNSKPGKTGETIPTEGEWVSYFTGFSQLRRWEMVFIRIGEIPNLEGEGS